MWLRPSGSRVAIMIFAAMPPCGAVRIGRTASRARGADRLDLFQGPCAWAGAVKRLQVRPQIYFPDGQGKSEKGRGRGRKIWIAPTGHFDQKIPGALPRAGRFSV